MGGRRKRVVVLALLLAAAAAAGGLLFAASGVYDVSAATGHWPITKRFLTFAMARSVAHHAAEIEVPPLDDPALVYLGLGHYDQGCAPCHGAPGQPRSPIVLDTVPEPPYLPDAVRQWEPQELFWITRRGLKYTGMPAWPALEREDEVWAVVAGLLRLPELDPAAYRRIVRGERLGALARVEDDARLIATAGEVGQDLVACARCHGLRGEGRGAGAFPPLAGQSESYLYEALRGYALGERQSGIMQPVVTALSDTDLRHLARYYAALPPAREAPEAAASPGAAAEPAEVAAARRRGEALATAGSPADAIPACSACHGPGGRRYPLYPELAGLPPFYLTQQLRLWRAGERSGTAQAKVMHAAARPLADDQIHDLALFYAALPPLHATAVGPSGTGDAARAAP